MIPLLTPIQIDTITEIQDNFQCEYSFNGHITQEYTNSYCVLDGGLGKTRIGVEIAKSILNDSKNYVLILANKIGVLKDEWSSCLNTMGINFKIIDAENRHIYLNSLSKKLLVLGNTRVYLMTYSQFSNSVDKSNHRTSDYILNKLPGLIIFDEFQTVTNTSTQTHLLTETIKFAHKTKMLALSATPYSSNKQLPYIAHILNNTGIDLNNEYVENDFTFFIRSNKTPPAKIQRQDFIIDMPFAEEEIKSIKAQNDIYRNKIKELEYKNNKRQKAARNITNNLYQPETLPQSKEDFIRKIMESASKSEKFVIFDNSGKSLKYLKNKPWIQEYKPVLYIGNMRKTTQENNIRLFNTDNDTRCLLTSKILGSRGLNLQISNHVFIVSPVKAEDVEQMEYRINRQGQLRDTFSFILFPIKNESKNYEKIIRTHKIINFRSKETFFYEINSWISQIRIGHDVKKENSNTLTKNYLNGFTKNEYGIKHPLELTYISECLTDKKKFNREKFLEIISFYCPEDNITKDIETLDCSNENYFFVINKVYNLIKESSSYRYIDLNNCKWISNSRIERNDILPSDVFLFGNQEINFIIDEVFKNITDPILFSFLAAKKYIENPVLKLPYYHRGRPPYLEKSVRTYLIFNTLNTQLEIFTKNPSKESLLHDLIDKWKKNVINNTSSKYILYLIWGLYQKSFPLNNCEINLRYNIPKGEITIEHIDLLIALLTSQIYPLRNLDLENEEIIFFEQMELDNFLNIPKEIKTDYCLIKDFLINEDEKKKEQLENLQNKYKIPDNNFFQLRNSNTICQDILRVIKKRLEKDTLYSPASKTES